MATNQGIRDGCRRPAVSCTRSTSRTFDEQGLHVTAVWESQAACETFFTERLAPALQSRPHGHPETTLSPLHRRFIAPDLTGAAA